MVSASLLQKQAINALDNQHAALLMVVGFMLIPYFAWLSLSVLALVTLRNSMQQGALLVIPAFTAHVVTLLLSVQLPVALFDGVIRVLPCYLLACTLRCTSSWRQTVLLFIVFAFLLVCGLHVLAPAFIVNQFEAFKAILLQINSTAEIVNRLEANELSLAVLSNYLVGVQLLCLFASTFFSLVFARRLQSSLFYPGGFEHEMLNFRADRFSLVLFALNSLGAYFHQPVALNCLPVVLCYFFLAGVSCGAQLLAQSSSLRRVVLLGLPCILLPRVVLPFYVVLGGLDSVVNFRSYLQVAAGKTT